ncbi:hypothetical protein RCL1_001173 [Eukaryota sp. TZLM3-RCL]
MQSLSVNESLHAYCEEDEQRASEGNITLVVQVPGSDDVSLTLPFSQTVEYVKFSLIRRLSDSLDFSNKEFGLYLDEQRLLEPMSLNDYPEFSVDGSYTTQLKFE